MEQICAKLLKRRLRPYKLSSVQSVPGIYVIGVKRARGIKYVPLYGQIKTREDTITTK